MYEQDITILFKGEQGNGKNDDNGSNMRRRSN